MEYKEIKKNKNLVDLINSFLDRGFKIIGFECIPPGVSMTPVDNMGSFHSESPNLVLKNKDNKRIYLGSKYLGKDYWNDKLFDDKKTIFIAYELK